MQDEWRDRMPRNTVLPRACQCWILVFPYLSLSLSLAQATEDRRGKEENLGLGCQGVQAFLDLQVIDILSLCMQASKRWASCPLWALPGQWNGPWQLERGRQAGSHVTCVLRVCFISLAAGLPGSPGAPGPQGPPGPSGRCNPEDCLYPMTSAQQKAGGKWRLQRKTSFLVRSPCPWSCWSVLFSHVLSRRLISGPFSFAFFSSDVAQTSKATIWILSDSNCKSVFFGCFPTLFCGFCFTVALSSTQFYIKMQASLSRALQKKSYEMIWATDDIQFVNSSTWLDFNFWTWIFEIYINIFFMFKFTIVA